MGIGGLFVAQAADVIGVHVIKAGQDEDAVQRNAGLAQLIVGVGLLAHVQQRRHVTLAQVFVFPQAADALCVMDKTTPLFEDSLMISQSL